MMAANVEQVQVAQGLNVDQVRRVLRLGLIGAAAVFVGWSRVAGWGGRLGRWHSVAFDEFVDGCWSDVIAIGDRIDIETGLEVS